MQSDSDNAKKDKARWQLLLGGRYQYMLESFFGF